VGVYGIGSEVFPDGVLRPVLLVLLIILTGGLHLDGLADVCDGFYAGHTRAEALRIMKDPHLGTMAVVGISSVLLMKVVLLSQLPGALLSSALLIFPAISRCGMVWAVKMAPYARSDGGTAEAFFRTLGPRQVWLASGLLSIWVALCAGSSGFVIVGLAAGATRLFVGYCTRRIGGMTGDTLGALNELLEILTLAAYFPLSRWQVGTGALLSPRWFW
jgi:adenosylcobinamide-GDP ribazoletransferase